MRRSLLAALALLPAAAVTLTGSQATARDAYPEGEVVFRPSCFQQLQEEERMASAPMAPATTGAARPRPMKKSKPKGAGGAPSAAAPPPPPAPAPAPSQGQKLTKEFLQAIPSGRSYQQSVGLADEGGDMDDAFGMAEEAEAPMDMAPEPEPEPELEDDRSRDSDKRLEAKPSRGPTMDWGATIFLSNDDSMSLASAQRLLYAVKNKVSFPVSQIRPHELLNYFSFDTVTPDADQAFDVLASAEQDGDTLEVAFAVKGATPDPEPLDLTVVVDRSGSMSADGRMEYTKRGLRKMADQLKSGDRLDVVLFDDTKCVPLENYVVGRDDPSLLAQTIDNMRPEGGTDLDLGLREGYRVAKSHRDTRHRNRRMMLLTDAMLNTGDVNPNTVTEIAKAYDGDGIRLTGVGVGRDFNDKILDMLTEKGKGAYVYLGSEAVVDRVFGVGFPSLVQTIAHDVHFELQLPDSLAMERFYGEEASTNKADIQPIHYYAGTSQVFLQDLAIDGKPKRGDKVTLTVSYRDAQTGEPAKRVFRTTVGDMLDADPHNVRKGKALMAWTDLLTEQAMGGDACGAPLDAYARRAARVSGDAEIGYVNGLIATRCGDFDLPDYVESAAPVAYKVKVDADIPIAEVSLSCPGGRWTESLSGSDTVARFDATPGACDLTLSGTVDMTAKVDVPETGGDLRCIVRGGRLNCS